MTLHLIQLHPNMTRLAAFAAAAGALPRGGDLGYALHLALRRALDAAAPQPFRLFAERGCLLAYCADLAAFEDARALPPIEPQTETAREALRLDHCETRPMPSFRTDIIMDFELRLRPVRRTGPEKRSKERPGEHDAYGLLIRTLKDRPRVEWPARENVYLDWAREKLEADGAMTVSRLRLTAMRRVEVARSRHGGLGFRHRIDGPDVTVTGRLSVNDAEVFARKLSKGIGRHRAFGFGMLLLKPPGR